HLVLHRVRRPARIAEQRRQLVALGEELRQHLEVLGIAAAPERAIELLARRRRFGEGHERKIVGVLRGERDLAVGAYGVPGHVVGRRAGEGGGGLGVEDDVGDGAGGVDVGGGLVVDLERTTDLAARQRPRQRRERRDARARRVEARGARLAERGAVGGGQLALERRQHARRR